MTRPSIEVQPGGTCRCECIIVREGEENLEYFMEIVKRGGEELARRVIDSINEALDESKKEEILADFTQKLDAEADPHREKGSWKGTVGLTFVNMSCPKCGKRNLPSNKYFFFICDCGSKKVIQDTDSPVVACCDCGQEYDADYHLLKSS